MNARAAEPGRLRQGYSALVAGLAAAVWVASRDLAPLSVPTTYDGYLPADPIAAQLIEPLLRAPSMGGVPWIVAALLALCLVSEAWLLAIVYGASAAAAAAAVIALVLTTPWTEAVRQGGAPAIALAFTWLSWSLFQTGRDRTSRGSGWLVAIALVNWTLAMVMWWLAIVCLPMVLAALTLGERRKRVRAGLVVVGVMSAVVGLALYCARVAALTAVSAADGAPAVSTADVLMQLFDAARGSDAGLDVGAASVLAVALAAVGAAAAQTRRRWRGGVVLSALAAAAIAMLWPFWRGGLLQFVLWSSTPFVAVGVTVVARTLAPRRDAIAAASVGAVLCAVSLGDRFTFHAAPEVSSRQPLAPALEAMAKDGALVVVEDLEVDAALLAAHGSGASGWRVPQDPSYVRAHVDSGRTIVAGPVARRHLELAGLLFQPLVDVSAAAGGIALSRVSGELHCAVVRSDRWSLLPGLEYTGRLGIEIPGGLGGQMTLVAGDDIRPPVIVANDRGDVLDVKVEPLLTAPAVDAPPPDYWFDGGDPARAPSQVVRVHLPSHPTAATLVDVSLGRRAPRVLARLMQLDQAARGRVCAAPLAAPELWSGAQGPLDVSVPLDSAAMLTAGWYGVEGAGDDRYRWTDQRAVALIPSAIRTALRVTLDAAPAVADGEPPAVTLRVNGVEQPALQMRSEPARYEWPIPARWWQAGTNELVFEISRVLRPSDVGGQDSRVLGMKVAGLALKRADP